MLHGVHKIISLYIGTTLRTPHKTIPICIGTILCTPRKTISICIRTTLRTPRKIIPKHIGMILCRSTQNEKKFCAPQAKLFL